ncbi:MAG: hypothetical protein ABW188_06915, partial [Rhodococcus fascians]
MSTPNRPGSRPVPPSDAEQPRTSARPQPAVRAGTPQNGGGRPPSRPGAPAPQQSGPQQGAPQQSGCQQSD